MDGVFTLVVHADTYQNLDSLEVKTALLSLLGKLTQVVHQSINRLKIANLIFLRWIIVDDLRAVGCTDSREILTERSTTVCHD